MKAKKKCIILILNIKIFFSILLSLLSVQGFSQVSLYGFSQSLGTYTELTSPTIIDSSTTSTSWDDGVSSSIPIPFSFKMNGKDYTSCRVNYNGYITFGATLPANNLYTPISNNTTYEVAVSALGMDLYSGSVGSSNAGRSISYSTIGTAPNRVFVVQWKNVLRYNVSGDWNFQIRLSESDNSINIVYGSCTASNTTSLSAQIGLRGANNTDYNNISLNINTLWYNNIEGGTANNSSVRTYLPASGTTFTWQYVYVYKLNILGALHDVYNTSTYVIPFGYQDFTGKIDKAIQTQGNGFNVYMETNQLAFYKAWVDWDKNGFFDDVTERVYTSGGAGIISTTFGVTIDSSIAPGDYKLRVRASGYPLGKSTYNSTESIQGETEDYLFTVVSYCSAYVISTTGATKCEGYTVPIKLRAKGSLSTTQFKWYDVEAGGTLLATTPVTSTTSTATNTEWTIPTISTTTTYYVEAINGTCTSNVRVPVTARINMIPNITFSTNDPKLCGDDDYVSITAASGNEIEYILEEDFENGSLGAFTNENIIDKGTTNNSKTIWQYKASIYRPALPNELVWFPAISSGVNGNGFAYATSDINNGSIENALLSNVITKNTNFVNLTLSFRMYFSKYSDNGNTTSDIVSIDVKTDGGAWVNNVYTISSDVGIGTRFDLRTFDLSAYKNASTIQFRLRYKADWNDGVAVDDIKLYGERPLSTSFTWTSTNPIKVYSDAAATTEYVQGTPISTIYVKPTLDQLETYRNWQLNATANLTNGCDAKGTSSISSQTKVWNQSTDDWNVAANWKPAVVAPAVPTVPSSTQCVIVRTPVNIYTANIDGIAKRVKVKLGGKLTIKTDRNLTVVEDLINEGAVGDVIVESNAGLIQRTSSSPNIGSITVKRDANLKRLDYNYWGSPVDGQNLKTFSPGTKNSRFYTYNTSNDLFDAIDPFANNFIPGKGYAIRASDSAPITPTVFNGEFKGVPNKGTITVPISNVGNGYNLVANPYPSNIDFEDLINPLLNNNSNIIYGTAYFWTNTNYNPQMQGANYPSNLPVGTQIINNYAVYNGTGGVGAPYASGTGNNNPVGTTTNCLSCTKPNRFIRPGQGFIVKAKAAGNLVFNDNIRAISGTAKFFNRSASKVSDESTDRFWLNLKNPLDFVNPLLIGYVKGASDNYELDYDAELFIYGGDSFYSILDDKKLAIQGKAYPFNENDVIPLGARFGMDGNYQISIDTPEGIFANGKNVFLKDKVTGVVTNLSENPYDFTAIAGESVDRFEVFYVNSVLGASKIEKNELSVYKNGNSFIIDSKEEINSIKLFDASGRIVFYKAIKGKTFNYSSDDLQNGVYVFEINISGKLYYKKIKK